MKTEIKLVEGTYVERALGNNIEFPDNSQILFHREGVEEPSVCSISRSEIGWVDRTSGEVYVILEGGLYNITKDCISTKSKDDVSLALLTSYRSIVSNTIYLNYGSDRTTTIFNRADTIACSTEWEGQLKTKQHSVITVYHHDKAVKYHDVGRVEKYLKEKFSCIYMATPNGIIAVPLRAVINIREV